MSNVDYTRGWEDAVDLILDIISEEMQYYFNNGYPEQGKTIERLLETVQDSLDNADSPL